MTLLYIQMKKNNNPTKKSGKPGGFSFADAFYGVKDIGFEYQQMKSEDPYTNPYPKVQPKKVQVPPKNKVTVVKKQPINKNKISGPVSISNQETFKVNSGKQFSQTFQLIPLQILKAHDHVYQLKKEKKLSYWEYNVFCQGISIKQILPEARVSFDFEATDVVQGGLGNCYFIASLASLAHLPAILRERIPKFKTYSAKTQIFTVNLFESGKYVEISVENLFPKIFAKPVGSDISIMVLEKAYAQLYGNYKILNVGHSYDSLHDLTGAPAFYIDLKNKQKLAQQLQLCFLERYPIIIASKQKIAHPQLSKKHSYNILDLKIDTDIYLKLRDPRGHSVDVEPIFEISQEERANGIFWVDYQMLVQNFEVITGCRVKYGYNYFYKTFKACELSNNNEGTMLLKLKNDGQINVTMHQKHKKFFDDKFKYQMLRIMLAKIEISPQNKIIIKKTIKAQFGVTQSVKIQEHLHPGTYLVFYKLGTQLNSKPKVPEEALTLSIYSDLTADSLEANILKSKNIKLQPYIINYIINHKQQFRSEINQQKLCRYFGPFYGYLCLFYDNKTNKNVMEQMNYNTDNITIKQSKVSLKIGEQKLILHQIGEANNCSHRFGFKTKTIYKN